MIGNDAAVAFAGAHGQLRAQRHAAGDGPQPARVDPAARQRLARLFADRCVDGIEADVERCRTYAESSPSIVTPLNHYIGYDEAAKIAKQALKERKTIREVVLERGHVAAGSSPRNSSTRCWTCCR